MILVVVICLIGITFGYYAYRSWLNIISVFFCLWTILSVTAGLGLYETDPLSFDTYTLIAIGLFFMLLGMVTSSSKQGNSIILMAIKTDRSYELNYKLVIPLYAISLIFLVSQLITVLSILKSGYSLMRIRYLAVDPEYNELRTSAINALFQNFIVTPTVYVGSAIFPLELLSGNRNKLFAYTTIVLSVLWVITTGGRSVLIWMIIYLLYSYVITKRKINIPKEYMRIGVLCIGLLFVVLVYFTKQRKGSDVDFLYQIYQYFAVPLLHFEYRLKELQSSYPEVYGYGLASMYGFVYFVIYPLHLLGFPYPELLTTIRYLSFTNLEQVVNLGSFVRMNAYVTTFFHFYLDGGFIGIIIGSFMYGGFVVACYRVAISNRDNKRWQLVFLLMAQKLLFSFVRFYFTQPTQAVTFILAFFIYKQCGNKTSDMSSQ